MTDSAARLSVALAGCYASSAWLPFVSGSQIASGAPFRPILRGGVDVWGNHDVRSITGRRPDSRHIGAPRAAAGARPMGFPLALGPPLFART